MGNNLGRKRQVVDEKYTRPQGLYQHKDVDHKKLKKLILDSKLAPCYPGDDECSSSDLEECPICFLHYPSLNRSRCCMKGICTECFLQMKTPNSARPTQCPFCKTSNYAVEYRGVKTKEEKGLEQIEEQRVIEAKIRMRQQELQDEEVRMIKLREAGSSSSVSEPSESVICITAAVEDEETVASHDSCAATEIRRLPVRPRHHREDDFDLDLEDIMVMEAIWLSIQENDKRQLPGCSNNNNTSSTGQYITEDDSNSGEHISVTDSSASHSGGFACAIAAFAERQQTGGEASSTTSTSTLSSSHRENLPDSPSLDVAGGSQIFKGKKRKTSLLLREEDSEKFHVGEPSRDDDTGWIDDTNISVAATTGSIYGDADEDEDEDEDEDGVAPTPFSSRDDASNGSFQLPVVPESFEEQMMLAMAVSLAEAGARTNAAQGVSWN